MQKVEKVLEGKEKCIWRWKVGGPGKSKGSWLGELEKMGEMMEVMAEPVEKGISH